MKKLWLFSAMLLLAVSAYSLSLESAYQDYLYGDYQEAIKKAQQLDENDAVLYFLGMSNIKMRNYSAARKYLSRLLKKYPDSGYCEQAWIKLADTYFLAQSYARAEDLYREILGKYPESTFLPLVNLRLAQVASKQGRWEERDKYLKKIKADYPKSCEMKFVKILEGYGDFFTVQVGAFRSEKNALSVKMELAREYPVYIVEDKNGSYVLYKVRVGKYKDRAKAEKVFLELLNDGYPARIFP